MNNQRRKLISNLNERLKKLQDDINSVLLDEESYFEYMPVNIQNSKKGIKTIQTIEYLENACDSIFETMNYLELAKN